ncbi:MAG TPA: MFS transporter [Xanthobacteraceae bacterium]|nr:MFS transporter [Xanthobacteraceae bacterium]
MSAQPAQGWVGAVAMAVVSQTAVALLTRVVPTLAPVLMATLGVGPSFIGVLVTLSSFGSILFYLAGMPLIRRAGSIRTLQIGMAVAALGTALLVSPDAAVLFIGSVLLGIGYAPSTPAGSDLLQRVAPKRHRALIFSIKQAGVPLGGMIAGAALPPLVAIDWRLSVAVAVALTLIVAAAMQVLREDLDRDRDRAQPLSAATFLAAENLMAPLVALRLSPRIPPIVFAAFCLAAAQGSVFAFMVAFLVTDTGLELTRAGLMFSIVQATGIVGRILLGGLADRLGSATTTLVATAITSTLTTIAFALVTPAWSFAALATLSAICGITVSSWNGLMLAEIAAAVPLARVAQATAGATLLIFLGYIVGPLGFSFVLEAAHSYAAAFLSLSVLTAAGAVVLLWRRGVA